MQKSYQGGREAEKYRTLVRNLTREEAIARDKLRAVNKAIQENPAPNAEFFRSMEQSLSQALQVVYGMRSFLPVQSSTSSTNILPTEESKFLSESLQITDQLIKEIVNRQKEIRHMCEALPKNQSVLSLNDSFDDTEQDEQSFEEKIVAKPVDQSGFAGFLFERPESFFDVGGVFHHLAGFNILTDASYLEKAYGVLRDQLIRAAIVNAGFNLTVTFWYYILNEMMATRFPNEMPVDYVFRVMHRAHYELSVLINLSEKINAAQPMESPAVALFILFLANIAVLAVGAMLHFRIDALRDMGQRYDQVNSMLSTFKLAFRVAILFILFVSLTNVITMNFYVVFPEQKEDKLSGSLLADTLTTSFYRGMLALTALVGPIATNLLLKTFGLAIYYFPDNVCRRRSFLPGASYLQDFEFGKSLHAAVSGHRAVSSSASSTSSIGSGQSDAEDIPLQAPPARGAAAYGSMPM